MYADDVVLVADSQAELQAMLVVVEINMSRWKMNWGDCTIFPENCIYIFDKS